MFLDMRGKPCPIPVIGAKKALASISGGEELSILVDNDIARQNLEKMARGLGRAFSFENRAGGDILVGIQAGEGESGEGEGEGGAGLVVAISHELMGGPDEELGRALMKSFIYSLTEMDAPPEHMLFLNGGVFLTTEGSGVLDDLKTLMDKGSQIASCGLCLNFYQRAEKLAIGGVTNMYALAQAMAGAKKLINI